MHSNLRNQCSSFMKLESRCVHHKYLHVQFKKSRYTISLWADDMTAARSVIEVLFSQKLAITE